MSRHLGTAGVALVIAIAAGCGTGRIDVTGTVTLDGQAITEGDIILLPVEEGVAPDAGYIEGGRFSVRTSPGPKKVEIRASREVPGKETPMGPLYEEYVPARYNSHTILRIDASPGGNNHHDFKLETK